jgi:hypothetical protein
MRHDPPLAGACLAGRFRHAPGARHEGPVRSDVDVARSGRLSRNVGRGAQPELARDRAHGLRHECDVLVQLDPE